MDAFFLEHILPAEYEERSTLKRQRDENHEELAAANGRIDGLVQATEGVLLIGTTLQQLIDGKTECERRNAELMQQMAGVLKNAREDAKKTVDHEQAERNAKRKKEVDDVYTAILYYGAVGARSSHSGQLKKTRRNGAARVRGIPSSANGAKGVGRSNPVGALFTDAIVRANCGAGHNAPDSHVLYFCDGGWVRSSCRCFEHAVVGNGTLAGVWRGSCVCCVAVILFAPGH
jgi:hypothetical protein